MSTSRATGRPGRGSADGSAAGPLLVYGPRSTTYDFGPGHPLTPQRFGPGIDLLRAVGAEPGLAPEPAPDADLLLGHLVAYVGTVRRFSADPSLPGAMGIGLSDNPAFAGMHEASAAVAGGSLRAMEAILRGDVEHAFHPGGGLHHAMPARASGFCIYNDPALAVIRARAEGLRVLYIDLDVHHGDGVQAMTFADPGVLTISLHESGRYLFPGTGSADELGEGAAAGTSVNVPLEPFTGEAAWLTAVRSLVPSLAAVFGPDVVVSQHGADSHAWDPLAHLRTTTTAMGEAARLVDALAHRWAGGRWLATGGGGYDAYRVVPRAWALTWLAGAHREAPIETPAAWRDRWAGEAAAFGTPGMPSTLLDDPNAGQPVGPQQEAADQRSLAVLARVRATVLPRLVREAEVRGWWRAAVVPARVGDPVAPGGGTGAAGVAGAARAVGSAGAAGADGGDATPLIVTLTAAELSRLAIATRTIPPFDPAEARELLVAGATDGARIVGAVVDRTLVGVAVAAPDGPDPRTEAMLALGVAPGRRRRGLGTALLRALAEGRAPGVGIRAAMGVAERDIVEPLDVELRTAVARRLLASAGFEHRAVSPDVGPDDPWALSGILPPR